MMTPLRVDFTLSTSMVLPARPIHLDALIAYAATEAALEKGVTGHIRDLGAVLPLGKEVRGDDWVWKASALIPSPDSMSDAGIRFITCKTNAQDIAVRLAEGSLADARSATALRKGKRSPAEVMLKMQKMHRPSTHEEGLPLLGKYIDTIRGSMKNAFLSYSVKNIRQLSAWCCGDEIEIETLLQRIHWIGSKGCRGHGTVQRIEVVEDASALERWKHRVIPWMEPGYVASDWAALPPYWDPAHRRQSYCPSEAIF
jgi:CRISPR type IV-associated protein Csf3